LADIQNDFVDVLESETPCTDCPALLAYKVGCDFQGLNIVGMNAGDELRMKPHYKVKVI